MRQSHERMNTVHLISCLVRCEGQKDPAMELFRHENPFTVKSAIGATGTGDLAGDFDRLMAGQFFLSLDHGPLGIFDSVKQFSRRAAYQTPLFLGSGIVASVIDEGVAVPVSKYSIDSSGLAPTKVAAMAITTKESAASQEGIATLEAELRQAVMLATDGKFLSVMAADAATVETASPDPLFDLQKLLLGVCLTGFCQPIFGISPATAVILSTWRDATSGQLLFPDMGPSGGMLLGCQAIVTAALTDSIMLIDPSGIVTGSENLALSISTAAMLEMDTEPAMDSATPAGPSGAVISLFQADCVGILGVRSFAAKLIRPSAVAILEDIAWTGMPTTTTTTAEG